MDSIKEEPMSINDGTALATITTSTNEKEPEKVSVALKLTQEAANNLIAKFSNAKFSTNSTKKTHTQFYLLMR